MLKKPITYTDYNGKVVTENFNFNLSTAELIKLEMSTMMLSEDGESTTGGLQEHIKAVIDSRSGKRIIEMFDMFVDASFGVRSEDGRKFTKNAEVLEDFKSTPAYDSLFLELVTSAHAGSAFLAGVMPPELVQQAEEAKVAQTGEKFQGQRPTLVSVDEAEGLKGVDESPHLLAAEDFRPQDKRSPQSKKVLVAKMMIKQGRPITITEELMDALTADELEKAMENDSKLV